MYESGCSWFRGYLYQKENAHHGFFLWNERALQVALSFCLNNPQASAYVMSLESTRNDERIGNVHVWVLHLEGVSEFMAMTTEGTGRLWNPYTKEK